MDSSRRMEYRNDLIYILNDIWESYCDCNIQGKKHINDVLAVLYHGGNHREALIYRLPYCPPGDALCVQTFFSCGNGEKVAELWLKVEEIRDQLHSIDSSNELFKSIVKTCGNIAEFFDDFLRLYEDDSDEDDSDEDDDDDVRRPETKSTKG
jgi:hypothetical protein